ncbi:MAPEG family protein [Catenovulum sp. 2E275]|uniref:MAPEG family protein n=1 Tax=Catenovulum sp. 2E275 TaxID=2980497 RepID=UPI0021D30B7D|nr:MAPEG family protein [Catenovulum sp. 2E275]MCU4675072.1 MAPEG family protein [Catenovulum sp. 2E275]
MIIAMFAMTLLTIIVGLIALKARFASVKNGSLPIKYFRLMQGENTPEIVIKTTRCFNNLFEVPILFYVICLLYLVTNSETISAQIIAWLFVGFRVLQAYIHLSYNNVRHRMLSFFAAIICILLLWIILLVKII